MVIPVTCSDAVYDFRASKRAIDDLLYNAKSKEYCNERGFKQKLIVELFKLGYYKNNESVFLNKDSK